VISMPAFAARRLMAAVPLIWGVLTLVFLLAALAPGRPFEAGGEEAPHPGAVDRLRSIYGTDRPLLDRYASWLSAFTAGDFGLSYTYRRPVSDLIGEALKNTFALAGLAIVLQFTAGILAGLAAALSAGGLLDRVISAGATIVYSIPSYWIGLVLVWILSVKAGWLPASQMRSIDTVPGGAGVVPDALRHLLLPCLSLTLPAAGGLALYVRDEMRAAMAARCVHAARARGIDRTSLVCRHALRQALLPVVTILGLVLPGLAGGSVVIEVLFAWPGMGRLLYQSVLARDMPLLLAGTCVVSIMVILGSLVADILGAIIDPRHRDEAGV